MIALLVIGAIFGFHPAAAPIFHAYRKSELARRRRIKARVTGGWTGVHRAASARRRGEGVC
ncbi:MULTISPECIES: hypothetical protein [unclassified Methylobacterium]|uniref:hypothetical protein n=1 Tax=unclassified Methylobacterium TaxID=2615210 RepID=UPI00123764B0|nr:MULTISPECIES: hypothetical protein [Methylobacterium]WFT78261.1 hypothetical protein QA634_23690 [Methylobacterium nodulans]